MEIFMRNIKKDLFWAFVILGLVFAGCNQATTPEETEEEVKDITLPIDHKALLGSDPSYPGAEIDLSGYKLADISKYSSVIVDAVLYATEDQPITVQENSLGQFTLLKTGSSNWDEANRVAPPQYNMKVKGETTLNVPTNASGIPGKLLVQTGAPDKVKFIEVKTITFIAKVSDVVLGVVFGGDYVSVSGNKITFTNATNSVGAAYYEFPASVLPLTGKTITVSYTLGKGYDPKLDHQLIIQAANGLNDVNTTSSGQQYKDTNDPDNPEDSGSGSFDLEGTSLENAAAATGFTLTSIRIVNNGGEWTDPANNKKHVREKSYSITIDNITVK
jgi:hypothetical protein